MDDFNTVTDELAIQNIYNMFHEKIRRYLARMIGEGDADDLTQDVFIKANASLGAFRGESSLSTWLHRIAANTATDYRRKAVAALQEQAAAQHLSDESTSEEDIAEDPNALPDTQLIRKEMNDCIRGIADKLPENYRTVLLLSEFEELTNSEIAEVLDISLETVKIRLHRARIRLRKELKAKCRLYRDERNELACERASSPLISFKK